MSLFIFLNLFSFSSTYPYLISTLFYMFFHFLHLLCFFFTLFGPVWEGSGSTQNGSGSGSSGGAALLVELESFLENIWQNGFS
jgi:hypothetical protein